MRFLLVLALVGFASARPDDDYSRYEHINSDDVVNNPRLLAATVKCFLGTGKCNPEAGDIKKWIPEAVQNSCEKCSEHQKNVVGKVMAAIIEKHPEDWKKLNKLHNPDGKFDEELKKFLNKYGK